MKEEVSDAVEETVTEEGSAAEAAVPEMPEESTPQDTVLAACIKERDDYKDQLLRSRAEFDNYRKRILRENEQLRVTAAQALIRELLPVRDNLERALNHADDAGGGLADGVRMILKQFEDVLAARGLEVIPADGAAFDPNVHEALSLMPSDLAAGMVITEYERGYRLGGVVLRPSKVVVSSGPAASVENNTETETEEQA